MYLKQNCQILPYSRKREHFRYTHKIHSSCDFLAANQACPILARWHQ